MNHYGVKGDYNIWMSRDVDQLIDQILVMDAQNGRTEAMGAIVSRWQKRLWAYAYRLTSDGEAAWDITQESWLAIIKGIRKLHDAANFRAWAYRITTNKSIDWMKKSRAAGRVSMEQVPEPRHQDSEQTGVKDLLEKLDIKKKVVLSLYYFEQLSIAEISTALNIPNGTVKSRLHKAREELKELWQKYIEE